ncbi:acyl-CoA thioesterase [Streptomyces fumanus]|uniref:Thioesterase n=1 Tax=Streptomyces fumanus TaxID=67302 RepID=A0A919B071_9ACTN|nr:hotdog domain-containing protein [Streptomyces fumanus]GHF34314.1 thioesterase [Streptomyces fumanus]
MTSAAEATTSVDHVPAGSAHQVEVHFEDLDATGVLHNSRYPLLAEHAFSAFWRSHGWHPDPARSAFSDSVQVVRTQSITYHFPITEPGPVTVRFWFDRAGRTSYTYAYRIESTDGSTLYADGTRVQINLDAKTLAPKELSDGIRAIAAPYLRAASDTPADGR